MITDDRRWMRKAIALGRNGLGTTAPNPPVGAVIVKDGKIIAKAFHQKAGQNHAELEAINAAGTPTKGATLYNTLEPCNHFGKTPPCCDAIIKAGIRRVVIANLDPNPNVRGGGIEVLKNHGIEVDIGVCSEEAKFLIEPFSKSFIVPQPFVTLKLAVTTNDRITTGRANERWLSSGPSKAFVQRLRSRSDCILVGKDTVIQDNPHLTNRLGRGSTPLRAYLDSNLDITDLGYLSDSLADTICLTCTGKPTTRNVLCLKDTHGRVDLCDAMKKLFERGIRNLLCEGGATLAASLLENNLVDRLILVHTPLTADEHGVELTRSYLETLKFKVSRKSGVDTINFYERN